MKKLQLILGIIFMSAILLSSHQINAFCGFYVAKTDTQLFNQKSEVIYVRDGDYSTITMSNDFEGEAKDFALVVPVPTILKEEDIKVVDRGIFDKLNAYSAPRLVEYFDTNPCMPVYKSYVTEDAIVMRAEMAESEINFTDDIDLGVTIEAQYEVGEYDILILSAKESAGLKTWLNTNNYKIPDGAEEVLDPYIKNNLKFFVVKVNLEKYHSSGVDYLNPIQIKYQSDRFMLPIRLGMANAKGEQDMLVYFFTKEGRVECTNYRTAEVPSNRNIPLFVEQNFSNFYLDLFNRNYVKESKNAVFLEYAWNVSPNAGIKCDPCVSPPPIFEDFREAGVHWAKDMSRNSEVYFTRLHVRYSRKHFPQDLFFQVTPNRQNFQCRYIITHPAQGDLSCDEGQAYLEELERRRKKEMDELIALTGWKGSYMQNYVKEHSNKLKKSSNEEEEEVAPLVLPQFPHRPEWLFIITSTIILLGMVGWSLTRIRKRLV